MNIFLKNYVDFRKHQSSYFNLPACYVVLIAFLLPGLLGTININFSAFGSIILLVVALFEKRSKMVRFYCLQYCFTSIVCNVLLTFLSLLSRIIVALQAFITILSFFVAVFMLFVFIYSIFNSFKYRGWKVPYMGNFVLDKVLNKIE